MTHNIPNKINGIRNEKIGKILHILPKICNIPVQNSKRPKGNLQYP